MMINDVVLYSKCGAFWCDVHIFCAKMLIIIVYSDLDFYWREIK